MTPRTRPIQRWAATLGTLLLAATIAPAATAQDEQSGLAPTMVVLDSSGSMVNNDAGGQTRIDAARDAARTFIEGAGDDAPLGLVIYGGNTGETPEDYDAGCRDITVVTGPESGNSAEMIDHVESLEPRGYTPIGDALRAAADELPDDGARTIVLVSDGIATCTPPPVCEVAEELKQQGVDLVINTVGFNVDPAAREELQCIAEAAGGTYADASDAESLAEEMNRATNRTYRAYESDLELIEGGAVVEDAAEVGRGTDAFRTTLPAPESGSSSSATSTWFTTPVAEGERVIVTAQTTQLPQLDNWGQGRMVLRPNLEGGGQNCELDENLSADPAMAGYQTSTVYSTVIGEDCDTGSLDISLERSGDWRPDEDVEIDVTVTRLGIPDVSGVPDPVDSAGDAPDIGAPSPDAGEVTPGVWFTDATELNAGDSVRADIVPGETQFFRIPVEQGQQLGYSATIVDEATGFEAPSVSSMLSFTAYNEARAEVTRGDNMPVRRDNEYSGGYGAPILFTNRFGGAAGEGSPDSDAARVWQDGTQYLAVKYDEVFSQAEIDAGTELPPLTYLLKADAVGEPVPAPTFTPVEAASTSTSAQPSEGAEETATDADAEATADEDAGFPVLWVVLGVVLLAVLGVVGYLLTRRRGQ